MNSLLHGQVNMPIRGLWCVDWVKQHSFYSQPRLPGAVPLFAFGKYQNFEPFPHMLWSLHRQPLPLCRHFNTNGTWRLSSNDQQLQLFSVPVSIRYPSYVCCECPVVSALTQAVLAILVSYSTTVVHHFTITALLRGHGFTSTSKNILFTWKAVPHGWLLWW